MDNDVELHSFNIKQRCSKEPFKEHLIVVHILLYPDGTRQLVPINYCDDACCCNECSNCKEALESEYLEKLYQLNLSNEPFLSAE